MSEPTEKLSPFVVSRRPGERVRIEVPPSSEPTVIYVEAHGRRSEFCVLSPGHVVRDRQELWERKVAEAGRDDQCLLPF